MTLFNGNATAAFAFKTGFSARALIGLLGNDDFSFKVSPDGAAFFDALKIDRTNGQVELSQPTILPGLSAAPTPPPTPSRATEFLAHPLLAAHPRREVPAALTICGGPWTARAVALLAP